MTPNFERIGLVVAAFLLLFHCHRVNTMDCGIVNFVRPAILGGTQTIRGEWPFIAAIYNHSNYICGGTVISYRHILTGIVIKHVGITVHIKKLIEQPKMPERTVHPLS